MYDLKDNVKPPTRYLGANVGEWKFSNGLQCWWMNEQKYIGNAIKLPKNLTEQKGKTLIYGKQVNRPISVTFRPELDVSQVLNPKEAQ